jgi:hypothetical protein
MTPSGTPSVMPTATVKLTPEPSATPLPSPAPTQTALPLTAPSPTPRDLAQQTPTVPRDAAIAGEAIPTGAMELAAAAGAFRRKGGSHIPCSKVIRCSRFSLARRTP